MKIGLVCSGGGHLRQLLLLRDWFTGYDHFFLTQKTSLGRSIPDESRRYYFCDVALGKLRHSPLAWVDLMRNLFRSLFVWIRERPDMIISTGAGSALGFLLLGRCLGSKIIFLETFAHIQTPSLTGKLIAPLAHAHFVQWAPLLKLYPKAQLVCPLVADQGKITAKPRDGHIILVTVGTHGGFDRLVAEVDRLAETGTLTGKIVVQLGPGEYHPTHADYFVDCSQDEMKQLQQNAWLVITHAGTGSILSALDAGCQVIAVARRAAHGEHYDDHQLQIIAELEQAGAILAAREIDEVANCIAQLPEFQPNRIKIDPSVITGALEERLKDWQ